MKKMLNVLLIASLFLLLFNCSVANVSAPQQTKADTSSVNFSEGSYDITATKALPYPITCNIPAFPMALKANRTFYVPHTDGYSYTWKYSSGIKGVYGGYVTIDGIKYQYFACQAIGTGTQTIYSFAKKSINGVVVDEMLTYTSFQVQNILYSNNPTELVMNYGKTFNAIDDDRYTYIWKDGRYADVYYGGIDSANNRNWAAVRGTGLGSGYLYLQRKHKETGNIEQILISVNVVQFGPLSTIIEYGWTPPQYNGTTKTYKLLQTIQGAVKYEWQLDTTASFGYITPNGIYCDLYIYYSPYFPTYTSKTVYLKVRGVASDGTTTDWIKKQVPYTIR